MFCTTASGVVKSITTSNPATNGGVSAAALAFSLRVQHIHAVAALGRDLCHQLARLSLPSTNTRIVSPLLSLARRS